MSNRRNTREHNLPDYANWQDGKTAASMKFARDVILLLQQESALTHEDRRILQDALQRVKSGEISFSTWVTPQEYLNEWKK